ncbi:MULTISPECIES: MerR family transcriptional regulator [unclassified Gordonia (in: high G+C Gram-positive bacteria)]|uniref:MerR family transcriptional regulator n=1 Tax=unclassified Gordonia (in: high G+C Gram-positive bacteria) TaxID=2657482 RepID=UPI0009ACC2AD|nr:MULTISPECIES: MerR family transcriptional regulator [unclassified Gordonia (in: high G+C Gram-positive bacteria)]MDF3281031.1 MerR family transcriptional regulator [Gordonia sp. N1V]OPX12898.1 MerR family transcriptional regulator [Gordonia sp. i37]
MTEYRIDDLARAAGTTTRNVRGYQDRGLLPRPLRRGRIAIYTDAHLKRLKVINDLLKRGFTIRHIGEFLTGVQRGDDLADVLGLREVVSERWSTTQSATVSADELAEMLHTTDPDNIARLTEFGLIRPDSDDPDPQGYVILDPETVAGYGRLVALGLTLSHILDVHAELDRAMDAAANTLISAGRRQVTLGHADGWIPQTAEESEKTTRLLTELRRSGQVSAHNALDRALDRDMARQLADYLDAARESGQDPELAD